MNNRREFIKKSILGMGAIATLSSFDLVAHKKSHLTILHTNDMHSRIDPFPINHPKHAGLGGMSRRAALIKKIRDSSENVLLLDAGDIFQGTPYFNEYGGKLEFQLMSKMGYDAATMGNHDFDNGLEGFLKMLPHAAFPFICSNYDFTNTILEGKTTPHRVIQKGPFRIGVLGVGVELNGLVQDKNYLETKYIDPVEKANDTARLLKDEENCNLVVCLSHLGFSYTSNIISDIRLAAQTENIDLIIGGHTHTFLKKPEVHLNRRGKKVLVNQVGWAGINLGRIDFEMTGSSTKSIAYGAIPLNSSQRI